MNKNDIKEVWAPLLLFVLFFLIEVFLKPSEAILTTLIVFISLVIMVLEIHRHEPQVFLLGLVMGLFIEVILGLISRQQFWDNASLLGVPTWLPIIWGIGFVIITRVGMKIEGVKWGKRQ